MINKIKNDIVNYTIDSILQNEISDSIKENKKMQISYDIHNKDIISEFNDDSVEVNADKINENSSNLYIDLLTAFGFLNELDKNIKGYKNTTLQITDSIKSKCLELIDKVKCYKYSISDSYNPEYVIEGFNSASVFDYNNELLHTDRYGQIIPFRCYALHNDKEYNVSLPLIRSENSLLYGGVVETADISIRFQLGNGFIDYYKESYDINDIINGSENIWSQTILSDSEFNMSFPNSSKSPMYVNDNCFYDIDNGAVVELEINFESVNTVNEISIHPYCKYPIDIIAIRYKQTDDEDEPLIEIFSPNKSQYGLSPTFTKNQQSYIFKDILCKRIYILFTQRHYEKDIYEYSTHDVYKNPLWLSSEKKNKLNDNYNLIYKPLYDDRRYLSVSSDILSANIIQTSQDLSDILIGAKNINRKVLKYEYQYGFRSIKCNNNHFDRTGFFVTNEINIKPNSTVVEIYTEECHHKDSNNNIVTDIEYYITGSNNPSVNDWKPILPTNKSIVDSELLIIQDNTTAFFRFKTNNVIDVLKDGVPITSNTSEYHLLLDESNDVFYGIKIFNYDYNAIYSIKYVPIFASKQVFIGDNITSTMESFKSNGESFITLSETPIITLEDNYCNVTITNVDDNFGVSTVVAKNVTNRYNQYIGYENLDKSTNEIQYYILDNVIYFNKKIKEGSTIDITYNHMITKIRLKGILRRNSNSDKWLTPKLKEIKYKIQ